MLSFMLAVWILFLDNSKRKYKKLCKACLPFLCHLPLFPGKPLSWASNSSSIVFLYTHEPLRFCKLMKTSVFHLVLKLAYTIKAKKKKVFQCNHFVWEIEPLVQKACTYIVVPLIHGFSYHWLTMIQSSWCSFWCIIRRSVVA